VTAVTRRPARPSREPGREPDAGCAERLIRRCDGSSVMQVGYVLRSGDQVARAAEQTTRPVTSAGCGDRAHCRLIWAALPTSWEAVYATQMGTFCAVRPWSLASRRAPWPGWELGCKRPEQPERPAGWAPPCSVAAGPARRIDLGTVRRQRAQTQSCVIARPVASPEPHTRLSRMLSTRYERSPWPVGAS